MSHEFFSSVKPPWEAVNLGYWFIFRGPDMLVEDSDGLLTVPRSERIGALRLSFVRQQYLGYLATDPPEHCFSGEVAEDLQPPDGMRFLGLRRLYGQLEEEHFWLAGRAIQIVDWDRTHQFCSRCGGRTETMPNERAKECQQCGFTSYPRLSPAIIVRVQRKSDNGAEILLARSHRHPSGLFSVLAGFVEPGETLEESVRREVREEVGIELRNIRYFGSQPWPFPNSLMLAFTADYAGGDIVLEEEEMAEAGWFKADSLPPIPPSISISRRLIDSFIEEQNHVNSQD